MRSVPSGVRIPSLFYHLLLPELGIPELLLIQEVSIVQLKVFPSLFMHILFLYLCIDLHAHAILILPMDLRLPNFLILLLFHLNIKYFG